MSADSASQPERTRVDAGLVWAALTLGLAAAFWPVLVDLTDHLIRHPWTRSVLVFPVLAWWVIRANHAYAPRETSKFLWLVLSLALVIELVAVGGDVIRLGRVALVIAVVGLLRGTGTARLATAGLFVWAVPLPSAFLEWASPGLLTLWSQLAAAVVPSVEAESVYSVRLLVSGDERIALVPHDGGLALGYAFAGLGWFRGVSAGGAWTRAFRKALRWAMLMFPVQGLIVVAAAGALAVAGESVARTVLDQVGWLGVVVGATFVVLRPTPFVDEADEQARC